MKGYFYIKDLHGDIGVNDGTKWVVELGSVLEGGIELLTADFFAQRDSTPKTMSSFEYSSCDSDYSNCALPNVLNSFNPFYPAFNGVYSDVVDGAQRGEFLASNSGDLYGIEGKGFGFDKLSVPINDIPSGGSTGSSTRGAFFVDFDETQDFFFFLVATQRDAGDTTTIGQWSHSYNWDSTTCTFWYRTQRLDIPSSYVDQTPYAFLTGGNSGWVNFGCGNTGLTLGNNPIVTQSICLVPTTPGQPNSIVISALDECCYQSPVLASPTEPDDWMNDINSFLFQRNFSSETITLTLQKDGITDLPILNNDYGIYYDFGSFVDYPDYKGVQIQWQKVLLLEGEGVYRLKIESNLISGLVTTYTIPFSLKEYTQNRANGTFRIQSVMNRYLEHIDFDFTGLNWVDGLRVEGFFGNRQAEYEDEYIIYSNRNSKRNRTELLNNYSCQTMLIPDCITDEIIEYHNFANKLLFTDYNLNNHKKSYIQKEVVFESMDSIEYNSQTHFARLELKYKDFVQNYLGKYCK